MISTAEAKAIPWEDLQKSVQDLLRQASRLQEQLEHIQSRVGELSIYRPLQAFRRLHDLSSEHNGLRVEVNDIVDGLAKIVMITPSKTMGETLSSCLDTMRLSAEMTRLQTKWIEVDSSVQQTGAFAFAVFALYVSLVSLFATLFLGVLPLVR